MTDSKKELSDFIAEHFSAYFAYELAKFVEKENICTKEEVEQIKKARNIALEQSFNQKN